MTGVQTCALPIYEVGKQTFAPSKAGAEGGFSAFLDRLSDPSVTYAFNLTGTVAFWAVLINTLFGVGISLLIVRYQFPGRRILSVLVDLPMSVSPVVVGLALVLAYSTGKGWFGEALASLGFYVIGTTPGLIMATAFVSLPLVGMASQAVLGEDLLAAAGIDWKGYVRLIGQRPSAQRVSADRKAAQEALKR